MFVSAARQICRCKDIQNDKAITTAFAFLIYLATGIPLPFTVTLYCDQITGKETLHVHNDLLQSHHPLK
jgi:hypothetical protein